MENTTQNSGIDIQGGEFKKFAWLRIIGAIVLALALLWAIIWVINTFDLSAIADSHKTKGAAQSRNAQRNSSEDSHPEETGTSHTGNISETHAATTDRASSHEMAETGAANHAGTGKSYETPGAFFVDSLIAPINYEVNERFWGWRPNDLINVTDNVNEMQKGVLEVTRRATVALTEKISRAGSASALNPHLENAMNSFMISSDSYWMPSAEAEYNKAIDELKTYKKQLTMKGAEFYTRSDSLIPLLQTLEDLLGSCDENLVKQKEDNGEPVSTFRADNYFYYAKGAAMAMTTILHAVDEEFKGLLETRNTRDIMHHAIESAHHASEIKPWIMVTEGSLNGILANHRANMAAHISHARYYLGLLVKTLST